MKKTTRRSLRRIRRKTRGAVVYVVTLSLGLALFLGLLHSCGAPGEQPFNPDRQQGVQILVETR